MAFLIQFAREESGQDMTEYNLLLAFVVMAAAAVFSTSGAAISNLWGKSTNHLSTAASFVGN